ncbi:hypothetical protein HMPREF3213_01782 [Heyndrickxia coagulans]|uniref:Uncharacterized protein n=1 Tax=Heyndrickxia coagulans TaxID=1398 RepID=A0A133KS42_HEYCO|nr:hypothetical protein HMPREF3213_01782 [Heyndrickxia coagulans]
MFSIKNTGENACKRFTFSQTLNTIVLDKVFPKETFLFQG